MGVLQHTRHHNSCPHQKCWESSDIPNPNNPPQGQDLPARLLASAREQLAALIDERRQKLYRGKLRYLANFNVLQEMTPLSEMLVVHVLSFLASTGKRMSVPTVPVSVVCVPCNLRIQSWPDVFEHIAYSDARLQRAV